MLELPSDLPPEVIPLAWLIGDWRGWGTAQVGVLGEEIYIWQESQVVVKGNQLKQVTETWRANPTKEKLDMAEDAVSGLRKLRRGSHLWKETQIWTFIRSIPAGMGQDQPVGQCDIEVKGGPRGSKARWEAHSLGPRIMSQSVTTDAAGVEKLSRMYGLVKSELFWAQDAQLKPALGPGDGQKPAAKNEGEGPADTSVSDFSARLARWQETD